MTRISVLYFFTPEVLVIPGTGLDLALDEDLRALLDVVADDFRGALEADEVVPLGLCRPSCSWASLARSAVASEKLATVMPPAVVRISWSLPTLAEEEYLR